MTTEPQGLCQPCDSNPQGVVVFGYTLKIKTIYSQILQRAGAILAEGGRGTPYNLFGLTLRGQVL